MTQHSAESYVRERFAGDPEISETFVNLQDPILRADMIRYLVLLGDGGLYTDLNTKSLKPIDDWIPSQYRDETNVVIGIEYDSLREHRWVDWTLDLQFSTWTILAKAKHPLLEYIAQEVIKGLNKLALKNGKTLSAIDPSREEVLDTTGPAFFTRAVFEFLSRSTESQYTWENITGLQEPRPVGDILIFPITAFGSGQTHSNAGEPDEEQALVEHLFKGSWKTDHVWEEGFRDEWFYEDDFEEDLEVQGERSDEEGFPGPPDREPSQDKGEEDGKGSAEDAKDG